MTTNYKRWQRLFLFCLGLALASAFCMKWMESDLWFKGSKFTILGLEFTYSQSRVAEILGGVDPHVATILRYHFHFDFVFMAGIFPGIAALCMMAAERNPGRSVRKILFMLALLQTIAWACDILENLKLLAWLKRPIATGEWEIFHLYVWTKWIIALTGFLFAIALLVARKK